ncbi:hypothetical protein ElyMa_004246000 [Elysia marginata]|uniref:Uncharacterized protein n=1 Tax=Elysia marginata TaxID=1093978 RepID=A0AAV4GUN1_9GAST|nr:hypothetical protein ElyMa_004246000 [Elysia marginata]
MNLGFRSLIDIKTSLGNNIQSHYSNEGAVCPPQLRPGEFVVGAADNIDQIQNPSSTTSIGSFHGTGEMVIIFRYEHRPFPLSLSTHKSLRQSKKSDLVNCLEELMQPVENRPPYDASLTEL